MSSNQVILFLIVGKNEPLYEAEIHKRGGTGNSDAVARQNYFVVHSALDLVEKASWTTQNMYLKVVDKVNHQQVSTFLTAGNIKFILLHAGKSEDTIRNFFNEVYELYVKGCVVGKKDFEIILVDRSLNQINSQRHVSRKSFFGSSIVVQAEEFEEATMTSMANS
eukprot:scaffold1561_cov129-Cylindrotheca_fusiformis.AAC.27